VDHAIHGIPPAGLVGLGVECGHELVVVRVDEPAEVLPFREQLLRGVPDQIEAAR
jgi:hypothetical protein